MHSIATRKVTILVTVCTFAFCTLANAEEPSSEPASSSSTSSPAESEGMGEGSVFDILQEENDTITMGRAPIKLIESGSSAWVIDRATIVRTAASSVAELLRLIPGVVVKDITPGAPEASLRFWAYTPDNHSLILIDGRYSQIDIFGDADWSGIDLNDVERIEVILGPSSTLFGAYAFAGVVNVVTRKADAKSPRGTFRVRSGVSSGNKGDTSEYPSQFGPLASAYAAWGQSFERASYRLSIGADYIPSFADLPLRDGSIGRVPYRRISALANAHQDAGQWQLLQQLFIRVKDSTAERIVLTPVTYEDYALTLQAIRKGLAGDDELKIMAWARHQRYLWSPKLGDLAIARLASYATSGEIFVQYRTRDLAHNRIIVGAQARLYSIKDTGIDPRFALSQIFSLFIEDTWRPIEPLIITAGVRVDTEENPSRPAFSRFSVSPRASIVWLPKPEHALRLEVATAFRNPTPHETLYTATNIEGVPILAGQTTLKNENIGQLSLGYNGKFGWFKPRAELFVARVANPIAGSGIKRDDPTEEVFGVPVTAAAGPNYDYKLPSVFQNYDLVFYWPGASMRLDADFGFLRLGLNYTFAPVSPQHSVGLHVSADYRGFNITANAYFVDEFTPIVEAVTVRTPARAFVNLALNYDITDQWSVQLAGTNLIDARFFIRPDEKGLRSPYTDSGNGERVGQRLWLAVTFAPK